MEEHLLKLTEEDVVNLPQEDLQKLAAGDVTKLLPKMRSIALFLAWTIKTDDEFRQYVHRGQLNRRDIAKACGVSTSVLTQNRVIRERLENLEKALRARGVLPALVDCEKTGAALAKNPLEDRLRRLEVENASLKAEVVRYQKFMQRYRMMEKFMSETVRMPR